jgi:hypothetical protein
LLVRNFPDSGHPVFLHLGMAPPMFWLLCCEGRSVVCIST